MILLVKDSTSLRVRQGSGDVTKIYLVTLPGVGVRFVIRFAHNDLLPELGDKPACRHLVYRLLFSPPGRVLQTAPAQKHPLSGWPICDPTGSRTRLPSLKSLCPN